MERLTVATVLLDGHEEIMPRIFDGLHNGYSL